jgi:hypothetical protein
MRYIINTEDSEGIIGMQIAKWEKEKKLSIIEKADPVIEIKEQLEKVAKALEIMKKSGYHSQVMRAWLHDQTKISYDKIDSLLKSQDDFFKQIGVIKSK